MIYNDFHSSVHLKVRQALAFLQAHNWARTIFKEEFTSIGKDNLTSAEKVVLDEAKGQCDLAENSLRILDANDVKVVKSHYVCQVLLYKSAFYYAKLNKRGLMTEREAGEFLEAIEEELYECHECREVVHENELTETHKLYRLSSIPKMMLQDLNLDKEVETYAKRNLRLSTVGEHGAEVDQFVDP